MMIEQTIFHTLRELLVLLQFGNGEAIRPFHLTVIQFDTLTVLSQSDGQRMGELCNRLLTDNSKMTRVIDALEGRGLARREADPTDRRAQVVFLTEAGSVLREEVTAVHQTYLQTQFDQLSTAQKEQLASLLTTLRTQIGIHHE